MTAAALLCRLHDGQSRNSPVIRDGVRLLVDHLPRWQPPGKDALSTIDMCYWRFGTDALFQYGGEEWRTWNRSLRQALVESQRTYDKTTMDKAHLDADGSWDPIGEWGPAGGRVYATAMGALILESYYRTPRVEERPEGDTPPQ
jgi:hypothetical protein